MLVEERRHEKSKAEAAREVRSRYREPLLTAAQALQSRLYNMFARGFLARYLSNGDAEQQQNARDYTVYVLAEFLCWAEIIRRDLRFLDVGDDADNRRFVELIEDTRNVLAGDHLPGAWRMFRGHQRAVGELLMTRTDDGHHESLGFVAFTERLEKDGEFSTWFDRLRRDVDAVAVAEAPRAERLILLQRALIDIIEYLDQDGVRLPDQNRQRLPLPSEAPAVH